jgi:hypothetical protein
MDKSIVLTEPFLEINLAHLLGKSLAQETFKQLILMVLRQTLKTKECLLGSKEKISFLCQKFTVTFKAVLQVL